MRKGKQYDFEKLAKPDMEDKRQMKDLVKQMFDAE